MHKLTGLYRNIINTLFNLSVYLSIVKTKQKKQLIELNLFYSIISASSDSVHLYRKVLPCAYPGLKNMCVRAIGIVVQRFGV